MPRVQMGHHLKTVDHTVDTANYKKLKQIEYEKQHEKSIIAYFNFI